MIMPVADLLLTDGRAGFRPTLRCRKLDMELKAVTAADSFGPAAQPPAPAWSETLAPGFNVKSPGCSRPAAKRFVPKLLPDQLEIPAVSGQAPETRESGGEL